MERADATAGKQEVPGSRKLVENIYRYTNVTLVQSSREKSLVLYKHSCSLSFAASRILFQSYVLLNYLSVHAVNAVSHE
jgi:hypothetical protein